MSSVAPIAPKAVLNLAAPPAAAGAVASGFPSAPAPPLDAEQLTRDVAGPQTMSMRSIMTGHPSQGLTPGGLAELLIAAEQGDPIAYLELAEEIEEKEWQYASVLGTRKRAVSQLPIEVMPAGDDAQAKDDAAFVRDWIERDTLENELFDILDAVGKGFSVTEIVWARTAQAWLPDRLELRDPRWFRINPVDGHTLALWTEDGPQALGPYKFIQHVHPSKSGLPIRGGLARPAAWAWMFKNFTLKQWLSFVEVYGLPLRVGKYDNNETEENIRLLMRAIAMIGTDAAAVFPKSMDVEFIDPKAKAAGGDGALFREKADYLDQQISKLVVGQTGTTDAIAGGHAVGRVHNEVRGDIERADAKLIAATLNRDLVRPMVILNRGPRARYPRLRIGRPEWVDVAGLAKAAQILVPLGMEVSMPALRKMTGLPEPQPGEAVLTPARAAPGTPPEAPPPTPDAPEVPATAAAALLEPLRASYGRLLAPSLPAVRDAIDETVDEALGGWLRQVDPIVAPIEALAADAASLETVRGRLTAAIAGMDVAELTELLARGMFGARIAGMLGTDT